MKLRMICAIAIALVLGGAGSALAVDDGTGGPESATPNAGACDRTPVSADTIDQFVQATPGVISGQIESVPADSLGQYQVVTGDVADQVTQMLAAFAGCIERDGPAGAYAFLQPGLSTVELIFLGVFDVNGAAPTAVASPSGFNPTLSVPDFAPKLIVQLPDDRVGAVVTSPQPGSELALLTLVNVDGRWLIEHVAPVSDNAQSDGSSGGGP